MDKPTGNITAYRLAPDLGIITSIYEDPQGILWVAAGLGLARFDPETKQFTLYPVPNSNKYKSFAYSVAKDPAGKLWVGCVGGVYQFDPSTGQFTVVVLDSSLVEQPFCLALHVDAEGTLWVGTFGNGVYRLDTKSYPRQ